MEKLKLYDSEYEILFNGNGNPTECFKNGELWRDISSDDLICQMIQEIKDLRKEIENQSNICKELTDEEYDLLSQGYIKEGQIRK